MLSLLSRLIVGCTLAALLSACALLPPPVPEPPQPAASPTVTPVPTLVSSQPEMPSTPIAASPSTPEALAQQIASEALGVQPDAITTVSVEEVEWGDASLGCPQPDYAYAQVITPGHKVVIEVGGKQYAVHLNTTGYGLICPPLQTP